MGGGTYPPDIWITAEGDQFVDFNSAHHVKFQLVRAGGRAAAKRTRI